MHLPECPPNGRACPKRRTGSARERGSSCSAEILHKACKGVRIAWIINAKKAEESDSLWHFLVTAFASANACSVIYCGIFYAHTDVYKRSDRTCTTTYPFGDFHIGIIRPIQIQNCAFMYIQCMQPNTALQSQTASWDIRGIPRWPCHKDETWPLWISILQAIPGSFVDGFIDIFKLL